MSLPSTSTADAHRAAPPHPAAAATGTFCEGPFVGLTFSTPSRTGVTNARGEFDFLPGEAVTLAIGELVLGTAAAGERLSLADLRAAGTEEEAGRKPLTAAAVTNRARFLLSFAPEPDFRHGVTVTAGIVEAVNRHVSGIDFAENENAFAAAPAVTGLFEELGLQLRGAAQARNHVRRSLAGITLLRDVRIPTRDGSHLFADVFLPSSRTPCPAILRLGVYGKAFEQGSIFDDEDLQAAEVREDRWFRSDNADLSPMVRYSENIVSANSSTWVPRGYAVVRIDGRGVGHSPGRLDPFSSQEARDYYDSIEWAAAQPWCDGKVGLYGASYHATTQWSVAALHPPHLAAIMPFASDGDGYRELAYPGGIYNGNYRSWWWHDMVGRARRPGSEANDFLGALAGHPFDDPSFYNSRGDAPLSADFSAIAVPVLTAVSQTMMLHGRAGFEAFRELTSPTQLLVVDATYMSYLYQDTLAVQEQFFDKYLRGIEPADVPPAVRLLMRLGHGVVEWRDEPTWPVPGTQYRRLYLDAACAGLGWDPPATARGTISYSADARSTAELPGAFLWSEPLTGTLELAGHFTARLWVSSSSPDADLFVALRVFDGDTEIHYPTREADPVAPLTWGVLKASHRAVDRSLSTPERPWHTHREADHAPLTSADEAVEVEVELMPATGRIAAGARLRLDVTPIEGPGAFLGLDRMYDESYHDGAVNRIHTGPGRPSYLSLPVVPPASGVAGER